jgi:hypothetical protein
MNRPLALAAALALLLLSGCSGGAAPVSGRVTLDGQPLAGANVTFQPLHSEGNADPGVGSYAKTADDGSYTLKQVEGDQPGAIVGKHRVEIVMPVLNPDELDRGDARPRYKLILPKRYNIDSELRCDVPAGGRSDANFDLK